MTAYRQYNIRSDDLVLEIGSGHDPVSRSDVLCDRYLEDNREREGVHDAVVDERPFVVADAEALPFRDKAFGYLICQHVLEHASSPERFIGEMCRVSRRGYVETPSRFWEAIYAAKEYHHWVLDNHDGKLIIAPKRSEDRSRFGGLFTELWKTHPDFRAFHTHSPELMFTYLEWDGAISFEIVPEASPCFELNDYRDVLSQIAARANAARKPSRTNAIYRSARAAAGRLRHKARHKAAAKRTDIDSLLCCAAPSCRGDLTKSSDQYHCSRCSRSYPIIAGIPRFIVE